MCWCQLYPTHPWNASLHSSPTAEMHWVLREKISNCFPGSSTRQSVVYFCERKLQGGILGGQNVISKVGICLGHQCQHVSLKYVFSEWSVSGVLIHSWLIPFPALPSYPARGVQGISQVFLPGQNTRNARCHFPTNRYMSSSHYIVSEGHFCSCVACTSQLNSSAKVHKGF